MQKLKTFPNHPSQYVNGWMGSKAILNEEFRGVIFKTTTSYKWNMDKTSISMQVSFYSFIDI